MPKYLIDMPEGWKPEKPCMNCPNNVTNNRGEWSCCAEIEFCPLANAVEAVEVKSGFDVCWGETQAYDFHSRQPVTLYAVVKEANNGKV